MGKRLFQIIGFLTSTLGWLFVLCTMVMNYWRFIQIGGQGGSAIIKVAWYWSSLWKDCYTESTAIDNCRDFPVLSSISSFVQRAKALLVCGLTLGFFGAIFCFVGMECTYIGGGEKNKDKVLLAGSLFHFVGGVSDIAAYCLYINKVARTTFAPTSSGVRQYNLGTPIFLGLVGSGFIVLGAILYAVTVYKVVFPKTSVVNAYGGPGAQPNMAPLSEGRIANTGYYVPPRQYGSNGLGRSSNSKLTRISQITPEKLSDRDAFV
ncbi:claudin-10 [Esox lucius]|uniref:claudin-10 n=1 Tax=Esox lucius TaxID=8010 RepID=UPI0009733FC6|nr:claudin-10 [Esox lucius]